MFFWPRAVVDADDWYLIYLLQKLSFTLILFTSENESATDSLNFLLVVVWVRHYCHRLELSPRYASY